jgi:phosphopantothenoylcysteine decarboxylase/phosphopantothenate--cysteine ligase
MVETAEEMLKACRSRLPADAAVCVAAVSDWRAVEVFKSKLKKGRTGPPTLDLVENPDILASLAARGPRRPKLVVGFAAETENLEAAGRAKLERKGCDWIVANDVSHGDIVGGDDNEVLLLTAQAVERWPRAPKAEIARSLAEKIAGALA